MTYPKMEKKNEWSCCNGWPTQEKVGLIVMGDLPKEKGKSGLIVMGDLPSGRLASL